MENAVFHYQLSDDMVIFTNTLRKNAPYISEKPRNHESLFFVTKGTLLYEKNHTKAIVNEGQVGYIARGSVDRSSAHGCDEVSYIAVNFCFDRQAECPSRTLPFETVCSERHFHNHEKLFRQAYHHFLSKAPGSIVICNGILLQIIGQLYKENQTQTSDFAKIKRIEKAVDHLKQHCGDPDLKIRDLAAMVNMSEKQFRRIFCDVYSKTPYLFLQEFRIRNAEILLIHTNKSISDIALQCGFADIYSFSHSFKNHNGISPMEYRNTV